MKVVILGPILNKKYSGGVSVFDEGLYDGFKKLGDDVKLISIAKSSNIDNISIEKSNPYKIFTCFKKIAKIIKKIKPDLVISSLQYCLGIKTYKKYYPFAIYVQVLHGFPCPINGRLKSSLFLLSVKLYKKYFDKLVTVSFLSYAINKKINRIICDAVIYNGCNFKVEQNTKHKRTIDFIYVGRLYRDKEVEMIADAFLILLKKNPHLNCCIIGYGELEELFTKGKYYNSGIKFLGRKNSDEIKKILLDSKFFISMNPLEPLGIVFNEAILSGCNIITQSTSGICPIYMKKPYFHVADSNNAIQLSTLLYETINHFIEISQTDINNFEKFLKYERCALEYKLLINKK